jgi:hypothetical protein
VWRGWGILDGMAYQNGSWPGHPQRYGPAQPATRGYPATRNHPGYPGNPATQSHPGYPATQTWPDASWPSEPPGPGQPPDYYGPPPPPPPGYGMGGAPVGVHIVAVMQYVTGLVLILAAGVIGVITFNDGRIGDSEVPQSIRGAVTGAGIAIAALALVAGFIALSIGRRLHRGRRGARILVIVLSAVSLGVNVYTLVTTGVADPLTGLVLPTLYLVLLNTPPVRAHFRRPY